MHGQELKLFRKFLKLTTTEFSTLLGISPYQVASVEIGRRKLPKPAAKLVALLRLNIVSKEQLKEV